MAICILPLTQLALHKQHSIDSMPSRPNVFAEWVETGRRHDLLSAYGCYNFQGDLFGKPVAVDEFMQQLLKI